MAEATADLRKFMSFDPVLSVFGIAKEKLCEMGLALESSNGCQGLRRCMEHAASATQRELRAIWRHDSGPPSLNRGYISTDRLPKT